MSEVGIFLTASGGIARQSRHPGAISFKVGVAVATFAMGACKDASNTNS